MLEYIKFAAVWVAFMFILGGVTLIVPKISAKIDKIRENSKAKKRENMFSLGQTSYMEPAEKPEAEGEKNGDAENKE